MTFKKGSPSWNKGKHHSDEHKKHLSENHYKSRSIKSRLKQAESMIGNKNPAWKGGTTQQNHRLRMQLKYVLWKEAVLERDNYSCQYCGNGSKKLHTHHIFEFAKYPELRYEVSNGITLCESCHRKIHGNILKEER